MKKFFLIFCIMLNQSFADTRDADFYEPNLSNKYQGRLLSTTEFYPIETMKKLCKPFTGIDTAQIRCRKQTKENNIQDQDGLTGILGSMLGGQPKENQSLIESLIDSDGDGSVLDDVADMVLGSNKKKGGLGGMLGGLFGK